MAVAVHPQAVASSFPQAAQGHARQRWPSSPPSAMPSFEWHFTPSSPASDQRRPRGMSSSPRHGPLSPTGDVSKTLRRLLFVDTAALRHEVGDCFDLVTLGDRHLDEHGLVLFVAYLSRRIGVQPSAFGDIHDQFLRFDFDGNGTLEPHETYKLVKAQLLRYWRRDLGHRIEVPVPTKTVEEAGYTTIKKLGEGGQGTVNLVKDRRKDFFCIKSYKKQPRGDDTGLTDLQEEFMKMKYLKNPHIAATHEIFQDANFYYVVNEPYYGGDLSTVKEKAENNGIELTKDWWRGLFRQCFSALAWMHEQAIMHCDMKEPNIMLKTEDYRKPEVAIIDLGCSRTSTASDGGGVCGTPGYIPPETWETGKWYPRGDNFSMGVTMMQLLTDKFIFTEGCTTLQQIAQATMTRNPPFQLMPEEYDDLTKLLMKLLDKDLQRRPKAPQVLKDAFFKEKSEVADLLTSFCTCRLR